MPNMSSNISGVSKEGRKKVVHFNEWLLPVVRLIREEEELKS